MNHKLKMKLRSYAKKNELFSKLYHKAARKKMEHFQELSDEDFLRRKFKENTGKELDLEHPQTFNEKLQWLKLYDHNPLYTQLVDKYRVRQYVAEKIGEEYLNDLYGVYEHFDDIDFNALPDQFVLKCNHDCGSIVICKDKQSFDFAAAKSKLEKALKRNYFYFGREWPYKNVKPLIVAEKYLENLNDRDLKDYKFFCFSGIPECLFIATDRATKDMRLDFYDMNFCHLPFERSYPNAAKKIEKPESFDEMKELAAKLSEGIPFVRVDFYEINEKPLFGEMTFYPGGGTDVFRPEKWDYIYGEMLRLPGKKNV